MKERETPLMETTTVQLQRPVSGITFTTVRHHTPWTQRAMDEPLKPSSDGAILSSTATGVFPYPPNLLFCTLKKVFLKLDGLH